MTNNEIAGCIVLFVLFLWVVYEIRNAPEIDKFD